MMVEANRKERLWTPSYLLVGGVNFLVMFIYYQITAIIAVYVMDDLGAAASLAGLAAGILIVAALIARILTGRYIEELGRKKTLGIGLLINLAAILLYLLADSVPVLFLVRIIHGIGFGMSTTATITVVANSVPESRKGEGIGYYMLSVTIASAFGPSLGIFLYQSSGFNSILALSGGTAALSLVTAFFLKVRSDGPVEERTVQPEGFRLSHFFEARVLPVSLVGFLVFFCYSSIIGFFSAYAKTIDLIEAGSLFFIVYSAATFASRPFTSRWFDSRGENFVMYPSFIIFAAGLIVLAMAGGGAFLLAAGVLLGVGFGTFVPSAQTIAVQLVEKKRVGVASSTFLAVSETGIGIGPFLLGFLVPRTGYRVMYLSLAGVMLISLFIYYLLHGKAASLKEAETVL